MGKMLFTLAILPFLAIPLAARTKAPDWLAQAARMPNPPFDPKDKPEVAVLWDEGIYEVKSDGKVFRRIRFAIRVLDHSGRGRAIARLPYFEKSQKINRFKAWSIDKNGKAYAYKKSEQTDRARTSHALYSDVRTRSINGSGRSIAGSVFGYEYEVEEATIFAQDYWRFQSDVPVAVSRLTVTLPKGWSLKETGVHGAPRARLSGSTYVWEMKDCPMKQREPGAPSSAVGYCHVNLDIYPPEGTRPKYSNFNIRDWQDVADYKASVQDPNSKPNDEIAAKARELTANASSDWEKIQSIGEYAKDLEYAIISYEVGSGGGYTPRSAAETFRVGYGDCKDKTALMRAMLESVGIKSYGVTVNALDNDRVNLDWPSTGYFNHCIAAVEIDESIDTPAVLQDANLGRLLFVDPTSTVTPIGELPFEGQGGFIIVGKQGSGGDPVRLPQSSPKDNLESREIEAEILPDGSIIGRIKNRYLGSRAEDERVDRRYKSENAYLKLQEQWIAGANKGALVDLINYKDNHLSDRSVEVVMDVAIKNYAQSMRGKLLVFKPAIVSRMVDNPYNEKKRTMPIAFRPKSYQEKVKIFIPEGFALDDAKRRIEIEEDFGRYQSTIAEDEGFLTYTRSLVFKDKMVQPDQYANVQAFYNSVIEADQSPVVLSKVVQ